MSAPLRTDDDLLAAGAEAVTDWPPIDDATATRTATALGNDADKVWQRDANEREQPAA